MATVMGPPTTEDQAVQPVTQGAGKVYWAGVINLYVSVGAFIVLAFLLYLNQTSQSPRTAVDQFIPEYILGALGIFFALLGVKLVRAGGVAPSDPLPVVHKKEWQILAEAITKNQNDPIGEYIRLSSLTGVTGVFTKLGLSGLPLATIGLTLFFALMSVWFPTEGRFYELTQLTLGAFIGSFVQRQVAALRESQEGPASGKGGSGTGGGGGTGTGTGESGGTEIGGERPPSAGAPLRTA